MKLQGQRVLSAAAQPLAGAFDRWFTLLRRRVSASPKQELHPRPLDTERLSRHFRELRNQWLLTPDYKPKQLEEQIATAQSRPGCGEFRAISLHDAGDKLAGWYIYYANPGGPSEVLQIAARTGMQDSVVYDLVERALRDKTIALTGRMDPHLQQALTNSVCALSRRDCLTLIHSADPRLIQLITTGSAFLSRLEGEWCLRFR
jgi:hypothetical protein